MAKVRKDNKGRNLRPGETQRADGSYMYVYKLGTKKKYLYDSDLASLRVKEKQINKDKDDGIRTQEAMKLTLNDMFKVYMNNNIKLKPSTRANYLYLWDFYVKEEPFANMPLPQIHRSDILAFYTKLLKHGFAINSLESINTIVHPTLEMAVDDDYIRKNPSKGIYRKLKTDGSAPKPKRRIALTKTQQQNFLRFIAKSPTYSHWLPIMTVLLGTGMRVAECTGITKSDINLSENTISVNHNLIYRVIDGKAGFHITTPKTESGTRIIPILYPEVAEQLRLQIETIDALYPDDQLVLGGVHGFVFRNRTGSFMSAHNINRLEQGFCQTVVDGPDDNPNNAAEDLFLQMIGRARREVYITTPYLAIDEPMLKALCLAAESGVDVRLIMPGIPDHKFAYLVAESYFDQLMAHDVKIYTFTPGLVHGKTVLTDRETAFVGSVNMDYRSFQLHFECGEVFYGTPAIETLLEDMDTTMARCAPMTPERMAERPFWRRAMGTVLRLFAMWM